MHRAARLHFSVLRQCQSVHRWSAATLAQAGQRPAFVAEDAVVIGRVTLGEDSSVFYQCVLRADINTIKIGPRSNVQDGSVLHVNDSQGVDVGEGVTIGHKAILHACTIGDRCIIGMGAIVMDGANIGAESVVAAGALVPPGKAFPPRSLLVGSPAKRVRDVNEKEFAWNLESAAKYVRVAQDHADSERSSQDP
eukprot:g60394.t1